MYGREAWEPPEAVLLSFVGVWVLCGVLGWMIGEGKGMGGVGLLLGLLLGLIGLLIIAVIPPRSDLSTIAAGGKWWPDPYGAHEYRYHNGRAWTAQVSDQGKLGIDPRSGVSN